MRHFALGPSDVLGAGKRLLTRVMRYSSEFKTLAASARVAAWTDSTPSHLLPIVRGRIFVGRLSIRSKTPGVRLRAWHLTLRVPSTAPLSGGRVQLTRWSGFDPWCVGGRRGYIISIALLVAPKFR